VNFVDIYEFFGGLSFQQSVWLLPPAFALHVLEEAPQFTAWVNRYGSRSYRFADFLRINALGLVMTTVLSVLTAFWPSQLIVFALFTLVVAQGLLFNPLFHAGATAAFGVYSPGLLTSLLVNLPLFFIVTARMYREGLLSSQAVWIALALAAGIHAAVVYRTVFQAKRT
jgi:uncharacterized protein with HXXEE motif